MSKGAHSLLRQFTKPTFWREENKDKVTRCGFFNLSNDILLVFYKKIYWIIFNHDDDCRSQFYYSLFFFSSFQLFKKIFSPSEFSKFVKIFFPSNISKFLPSNFSKLVQYLYCYRWQFYYLLFNQGDTTTVGCSSSIHFFFSLLKKNFLK